MINLNLKEKIEYSLNDIKKEFARSAYNAVSFDPDRQGDRERESYVKTISYMIDLAEIKLTDETQIDKAVEFLNSFREKLLTKWIDYLSAKSRCMSSMITGPANFPVERNRKRLGTEHKRSVKLSEFIDNSEKNMLKMLENSKPEEIKNLEIKNQITNNIKAISRNIEDSKKLIYRVK
jgi:hypothetical protein